jgi:hypothetical protein
MRFSVKASHLPPRIAAGAFILNSGVGKWSADEETAAQLHGFAVGTYPFLAKLKPKDFARLLAASEIALGASLLVPVIPSAVVGAGLTVFSGALLGLYARHAQGRHPVPHPAGHRPSQRRLDARHRPRPSHRRPHLTPRSRR